MLHEVTYQILSTGVMREIFYSLNSPLNCLFPGNNLFTLIYPCQGPKDEFNWRIFKCSSITGQKVQLTCVSTSCYLYSTVLALRISLWINSDKVIIISLLSDIFLCCVVTFFKCKMCALGQDTSGNRCFDVIFLTQGYSRSGALPNNHNSLLQRSHGRMLVILPWL